ncbi:hypothetical protein BJV82DRAFT_221787 [Fennellomyces sp. T-0311]|nr:hypothetical protein BJV82DRAFT_221787 [Fennellomyces sp. T-0311]
MHNASAPLVSQAQFVNESHRTVSMQSVGTASSYGNSKHRQSSMKSIASIQRPVSSVPIVTSTTPVTSTITATPSNVVAPAAAAPEAKKDEARALHGYHANAEDPNELSFDKDEVLEIIDKRGNWWQARKKDGTVGIVPSNYFTP